MKLPSVQVGDVIAYETLINGKITTFWIIAFNEYETCLLDENGWGFWWTYSHAYKFIPETKMLKYNK